MRAGIDPHEHEFEPVEDYYPILEDGAAIFIEECIHAPLLGRGYDAGRDEYHEAHGEKCGEERHTRFEARSATKVHNHQPNLTVHASVLDGDGENELLEVWEQALFEIERADQHDEVAINSVDPDKTHGEVVAEANGYRVKYEPVPVDNRRAD
jgi:hypothetical protein